MKDLPVCGFSHNYVRYQHTSVRIALTSDLAACDNKLVESVEYLRLHSKLATISSILVD